MLSKKYVFNIVGKQDNVNKAAIEIKNLLLQLTNEEPTIIMENKDSIIQKINKNNYYINKYYFESDNNLEKSSENIINLSRHIRNSSRDYIHPWVMHVENENDPPVSEFMKMCNQVNCVYSLNENLDITPFLI
jgi:hypothetical protein